MAEPPLSHPLSQPTVTDREAVANQLGRKPRSDFSVAARGGCGLPAVIQTPPRLADGTPFPTLWYLTCRRLNAAVSTLESQGVMGQLTQTLGADPELAAEYLAAHKSYLASRERIESVERLQGVSAGGMPDRVKCLHALVAHSLAVGPGVNPIGDRALELLRERGVWPCRLPCVALEG